MLSSRRKSVWCCSAPLSVTALACRVPDGLIDHFTIRSKSNERLPVGRSDPSTDQGGGRKPLALAVEYERPAAVSTCEIFCAVNVAFGPAGSTRLNVELSKAYM